MSPVGPLPQEVYWRRRGTVVAAVVLAVVLLVWLVTAMTGGSDPQPSAQQTPLVSSTAAPTTTTPATTTPTPEPTTSEVAPSPAPSPAPTVTTPPAAPPATTAAGAAPTCPDATTAVTAQVAQPSYQVGELPVFRILVANTGTVACTRDLDAALQSVVVYAADGTTRLWSSNDCFPEKSTDAPTLAPGEVQTYSVKWSGTTSEPTCTADRTAVPAGTYQVVASLGTLTSQPVPFILTPA